MRGKIVLVPSKCASGRAGPRQLYRGVLCDALVGLPNRYLWYDSYNLKRLPPFRITRLSCIKHWALALVHEAEHVRQHHQDKGYSELKADRAVLRAQKVLGWGRLHLNQPFRFSDGDRYWQ
jgi:hypothetical protein